MRTPDAEFDRRMMATALAAAHNGTPSPNPHVGAVIVRDGQVLAVGHHERAGTAHAEVAALRKLDHRAPGATMYVTLEPCSHQGRTSPCCEAVLAAGITRVVIGCEDPIEAHAGGARRLRAAGVEVQLGVLRADAELLIADFRKHARQGLPYLVLDAPLAQVPSGIRATPDRVPFDAILLAEGVRTEGLPAGPAPRAVPPAVFQSRTALVDLLQQLAAEERVRVLLRTPAALAGSLLDSGLIDAVRIPPAAG